MAQARSGRADGIDAVSIVTPNDIHWPAAKAFLEARHPRHLRQAADHDAGRREALAALVAEPARVFVLTHNYTGYPMVRQAREMVADGLARRRSASCRPSTRRTG